VVPFRTLIEIIRSLAGRMAPSAGGAELKQSLYSLGFGTRDLDYGDRNIG
jgi:hypothetical protein